MAGRGTAIRDKNDGRANCLCANLFVNQFVCEAMPEASKGRNAIPPSTGNPAAVGVNQRHLSKSRELCDI